MKSEHCQLAICRQHLRQVRRRLPRRRKRLLAMTARGGRLLEIMAWGKWSLSMLAGDVWLEKRGADFFVPASFRAAGGVFVMFRGSPEVAA